MLRHSLLSLDGEIKENGMGYNFSLNSGRDVHGRVFIVDGTSEQSMSEIVLSFEGDDSGLDEIIHKLSFHPLGKHVIYKELYSLMDVYSLDKEP